MDWKARRIETHIPGHRPEILGKDDTINGGDVLPGFSLPVKQVFDR